MAKEKHDATPSWSGYQYQGKIAIFHTLRVINKFLLTDKEFDFKGYKLELEWTEDFAIKNVDVYESIHQVKAFKNSNPGQYGKAIANLYEKLKNYPDSKAYLHVWIKIQFSGKIKDFESMKQHYRIEDFPKELESRLELYEYSTGVCCCGLEEIEEKIQDEIKTYYEIKGVSNLKRTKNQYEEVMFRFIKIIDDYIIQRHRGYKKSKKDTISFMTITEKLNINYEEPTVEYSELKLKNEICNQLQNFCIEPTLCKQPDCARCSLTTIITMLNEMSRSEVREILEKASPHIDVKKNELSKLYNNKYGILYSWFNCLYLIDLQKSINFPGKKELKYRSNKPETMLPTTINESEKAINTIAYDIWNNDNLKILPYLYDVDCMISSDIDIPNLLEAAKNIRGFDENELKKEKLIQDERKNDMMMKQHIARRQNMRISRLDDVIGDFL